MSEENGAATATEEAPAEAGKVVTKPKKEKNEVLTASNFKGEEALLDLDELFESEDLQARDKKEDVERQAEGVCDILTRTDAQAKEEAKKIDRIRVIRIPEGTNRRIDGSPVMPGLYPVDGHARVKGFKKAGRTKIPAYVRVGTWEDAVNVATSANAEHKAMPRSSADKRNAVIKSICNNPDWSDRQHSAHCRVSTDLPKKCRPEAEKLLRKMGKTDEEIKPAKRVGKDGKVQSAKKKGAKSAKKTFDWEAQRARFSPFAKFLGAALELDGRGEKDCPYYQKIVSAMMAVFMQTKLWEEYLKKK